MALPPMTAEQRQAGLEAAARTRAARAELKAQLKNGSVDTVEVFSGQNEIAAAMPVRQLVEALPGWGKSKAATMFEEIGIDGAKRLRGLGSRQRETLASRVLTA